MPTAKRKIGDNKVSDWRVSGIADLAHGGVFFGGGVWLYAFTSRSIKIEDTPPGFGGAWPFVFAGIGLVASLDPKKLREVLTLATLVQKVAKEKSTLRKAVDIALKGKVTAELITGGGEGTAIQCVRPFSPRDLSASMGRVSNLGVSNSLLAAGLTALTAAPITPANLTIGSLAWDCWFASQSAASLKLRPSFDLKFSGAVVGGVWLDAFDFEIDETMSLAPEDPYSPLGRWRVQFEEWRKTYEYTFDVNNKVRWTDLSDKRTGTGSWRPSSGHILIAWDPPLKDTEFWGTPLNFQRQRGTYQGKEKNTTIAAEWLGP